jgi:hypothetical protein
MGVPLTRHRIQTVKRFLIFALLGPLLGGIVLFSIVYPAGWLACGETLTPDEFLKAPLLGIVMFPMAFVLGILPALMAGLLDAYLAKKRTLSLGVVRLARVGCQLSVLA